MQFASAKKSPYQGLGKKSDSNLLPLSQDTVWAFCPILGRPKWKWRILFIIVSCLVQITGNYGNIFAKKNFPKENFSLRKSIGKKLKYCSYKAWWEFHSRNQTCAGGKEPLVQALLRAGPISTGRSGLWPGECWVSPRTESPWPLRTSIQCLKDFSLTSSEDVSCRSLCQLPLVTAQLWEESVSIISPHSH